MFFKVNNKIFIVVFLETYNKSATESIILILYLDIIIN